ncbi:hypothetical protein LLG90_22400 [Aromatoleum toluclasticum]|uniref:hypothetical protein n=1 Tax=Aromatoleum toluclasticum TaxID=92003 RepID=UPI001D17ED40|nr:hypothetical protein [Aromatoleum toluclasticum]MCC4118110.1 hypothetical protein [Aromatoleum toluclasticum]
MAQYDESVIQVYADALYERAAVIVFQYSAGVGVLGALGAHFSVGDQTAITAGFGIGALFGFILGRGKSFRLRLEAQTALCQMQIERNTRPSSRAPSLVLDEHATQCIAEDKAAPAPSEQSEAMARAIFSNNGEAVSRLIAGGADVNLPNENGVTPLQMARNCERREITALLIAAGAQK